ncbi:MAG: hypothetical protein E7651_07420 [Ruminococcaceae bacterium]|nr:hypothetical protein [Oscillospiraceae bacterium]
MKKLLILALALMMLALPVLTACNSSQGGGTSDATSQGGTTSEGGEVSDDPLATFPLEAKKFDNVTIKILTRAGRHAQQFVPQDEFEGSVINSAVQARNDLIEEQYGIIIEIEMTGRPATDIGLSIEGGTSDYQIVNDAVYSMVSRVTDNWFYSLNDLLDLSQPWWDQNACNQLTLSDKKFFVAGNALFQDDSFTAGVLFNKNVYADRYEKTYGSLYNMVDEGTWTIDVMYELAKDFAMPDENGDWMTDGCYYGVVTDGYSGATMLTNGAGAVSAYKDEQNQIVLSGGSEQSVKAFEKVYNLLTDRTTSVFAEQFKPTNWGYGSNLFIANHALFSVGYLSSLLGIMTNETPDKVVPGVLPPPKYEAAQEGYHAGINVYQSDVMAIPVCVVEEEQLEATAYAMELLGYYSMKESLFGEDSVTAAFYDTSMKLQATVDDNDSRMLDLITSHRIYDLGGAFDWNGKMIGLYSSNLYAGANTLASTWDANLPGVEAAMQETIEAFQNSIN